MTGQTQSPAGPPLEDDDRPRTEGERTEDDWPDTRLGESATVDTDDPLDPAKGDYILTLANGDRVRSPFPGATFHNDQQVTGFVYAPPTDDQTDQ